MRHRDKDKAVVRDVAEATEISPQLRQAGELIRSLYTKITRIESKKHLFKDYTDLTLIEIETLLAIGLGNQKSMSRIAAELGVTLGTPTVAIDRLVKKGHVERIRDIEDRRQVFVRLSDKGEAVIARIIQLKERITSRIFSILTEEERLTMIHAMGKINVGLDEIIDEYAHSMSSSDEGLSS